MNFLIKIFKIPKKRREKITAVFFLIRLSYRVFNVTIYKNVTERIYD